MPVLFMSLAGMTTPQSVSQKTSPAIAEDINPPYGHLGQGQAYSHSDELWPLRRNSAGLTDGRHIHNVPLLLTLPPERRAQPTAASPSPHSHVRARFQLNRELALPLKKRSV